MFPGSPSPQRGEARWGQWRWPWDTGAPRMPRFPPSNLPPLGGGQEQRSDTKSTKWDVLLQKSPYTEPLLHHCRHSHAAPLIDRLQDSLRHRDRAHTLFPIR